MWPWNSVSENRSSAYLRIWLSTSAPVIYRSWWGKVPVGVEISITLLRVIGENPPATQQERQVHRYWSCSISTPWIIFIKLYEECGGFSPSIDFIKFELKTPKPPKCCRHLQWAHLALSQRLGPQRDDICMHLQIQVRTYNYNCTYVYYLLVVISS